MNQGREICHEDESQKQPHGSSVFSLLRRKLQIWQRREYLN